MKKGGWGCGSGEAVSARAGIRGQIECDECVARRVSVQTAPTTRVASLTRADGNNYDRVSRLVADLAARVLTFDERERLADVVARLGPAEVADAYDGLVDPARGNRLTVLSPGIAGTAARDGASILSIEAFRMSASSRSAAGRR